MKFLTVLLWIFLSGCTPKIPITIKASKIINLDENHHSLSTVVDIYFLKNKTNNWMQMYLKKKEFTIHPSQHFEEKLKLPEMTKYILVHASFRKNQRMKTTDSVPLNSYEKWITRIEVDVNQSGIYLLKKYL